MNNAIDLTKDCSATMACLSLGVPKASFYRAKQVIRPQLEKHAPRRSPLALSAAEKQVILDLLHEPDYVDLSPYIVYSKLLDKGLYFASISTFYRILKANAETRPRRRQLVHPTYEKPELLATKPCEVWSWDITLLKGPIKGVHFYLYVIIDIFSRYVVGWIVAHCEKEEIAKYFIEQTCDREAISSHQLTLHADRGGVMRSQPVTRLLVELGVVKSHNRPHVSNDNPYSESQFKTLKYCPSFPAKFESLEGAREFCATFFSWYNEQHLHSGIGYVTPSDLHNGRAQAVYNQRVATLQKAFKAHPNRFKNTMPLPQNLPTEAGINMPKPENKNKNIPAKLPKLNDKTSQSD